MPFQASRVCHRALCSGSDNGVGMVLERELRKLTELAKMMEAKWASVQDHSPAPDSSRKPGQEPIILPRPAQVGPGEARGARGGPKPPRYWV